MNLTILNRPVIEEWLFYEAWVEVLVMIPTLLLNIYFTIRISKLSSFSASFRMLITIQTVLTSVTALVHPLQYFLPEQYYSVKDGNFCMAILMYGTYGTLHFGMFLIESKYLLIAIERVIAFNQRRTYESRGACIAYYIMFYFSLISAVIFLIKSKLIWDHYNDLAIDARLRKVTMFDRSYYGYCLNYILATISTVAAIYLFYRVHYQVNDLCHEYCSLSERFQVRQTKLVLDYVKSLVSAFIILLITCGIGHSAGTYLKFVGGYVEDDPEVVFVYTFLYISLCMYNFACMLYMIRSFPQLQKAILRDLPFLERHKVDDLPVRIAPAEETETYFSQLRKSWGEGCI